MCAQCSSLLPVFYAKQSGPGVCIIYDVVIAGEVAVSERGVQARDRMNMHEKYKEHSSHMSVRMRWLTLIFRVRTFEAAGYDNREVQGANLNATLAILVHDYQNAGGEGQNCSSSDNTGNVCVRQGGTTTTRECGG